MKTADATAEVFFMAFKSLKSKEKDAFLEKMIHDRDLRQDLIDVALIEKAKRVKGAHMLASEYFARRRSK